MAKVVCSVYEWQNIILNNLHSTDFLTAHLKEKTMKTAILPKAIVAAFFLAMLVVPVPATADAILGTWLSPPDGKKQTGHVVVSRCGAAFCGKLVRTYDRYGAPITTRNTGKVLFWDLVELHKGAYRNGRVYVPIMRLTANASIDVLGDKLMIRGCAGPICKKQTWTRVK